jgi:hypothetical protein
MIDPADIDGIAGRVMVEETGSNPRFTGSSSSDIPTCTATSAVTVKLTFRTAMLLE